MITQLPLLPEIMPPVLPSKHYAWFKLANANPSGPWKRTHFYPFKERFLARFAERDDYDLQTFECWNAEGNQWCDCGRCDDGIYRKIYLERWLMPNGDVYHRPSSFITIGDQTPRNTFRGLIQHGSVTESTARRAHLRLALIYDRPNFVPLLNAAFREARACIYLHNQYLKVSYKLLCAWHRLYARTHAATDQDVPF